MGYAIVESFLNHGAEVFLVSGPGWIYPDHPNLKIAKVNSAWQMYMASCGLFEEIDIAVFSSAVADYRPEYVSEQKIKKDHSSFTIKMVKNIDIAY